MPELKDLYHEEQQELKTAIGNAVQNFYETTGICVEELTVRPTLVFRGNSWQLLNIGECNLHFKF